MARSSSASGDKWLAERKLLNRIRQMIKKTSGPDYDRWFRINRYVYARLQLDERKTKSLIKKALLGSAMGLSCGHCGEEFKNPKGVDLHRINAAKGYHRGNCMLLHPWCHQEVERNGQGASARGACITKSSKRYRGRRYSYWWDISPGIGHDRLLKARGYYELIEADTGRKHRLTSGIIERHLTPERRTSRGRGNWGIRILAERPSCLAVEPANRTQGWLWLL